MRQNNKSEMTIVEQLAVIKSDACKYACKFKEDVELRYPDPIMQKVRLQGHCHYCPLNNILIGKETVK